MFSDYVSGIDAASLPEKKSHMHVADASGPDWDQVVVMAAQSKDLSHFAARLIDSAWWKVYRDEFQHLNAIYLKCDSSFDFKALFVEKPSAAKITRMLEATDPASGKDSIDIATTAVLVCETVYNHGLKFQKASYMIGKVTDSLPTMRADVAKAKLFICMATSWDLMLNPEDTSRKQRKADVVNLRLAVENACAKDFPAAMFQMLDKWVDGVDIVSFAP